MAKAKSKWFKKFLAKWNRRTRWAPLWATLKKFGRIVHPSRITRIKRFWRSHSRIRRKL